jgi:hypothetical protein
VTNSLRGFGVDIVRELEIARTVQSSIEHFYGIDHVADVADYCTHGLGREQLFVRKASDGAVELMLELPKIDGGLDGVCQIIEGVSHFVYVATRAAQDRATTALELELQAEVDKWVILAGDLEMLDVDRSAMLRNRLYERVTYSNALLEERYRLANDTALRFIRRLERTHVAERRFSALRNELHAFFACGQEEKLRAGAGSSC